MALSTITTKGQITIPKSVRDSLKLKTGDRIEFIITDKQEAIIRPVSKKVDEVFGILNQPGRKPVSADEMKVGIRMRHRADV